MLAPFLAAVATASHAIDAADRPREWKVLLRLPGVRVTAFDAAPDGTIFVGVPGALFRATPGSGDAWHVLAEIDEVPVRLYALAADRVLALTQRPGAIYEWSSAGGWSRLTAQIAPSVGAEGAPVWPYVNEIWVRDSTEAYAVGDHGLVLRFDGDQWTRVPSDGLPLERWTAVGGDGDRLVIAAVSTWERTGGAWRQIARDSGENRRCAVNGVVVHRGQLVIAGWGTQHCLYRLTESGWRSLSRSIAGFRDYVAAARVQPDGSTLLWSYAGDVARIDRRAVTVHATPPFGEFGGAVLHDSSLIVAGTLGGAGVVARMAVNR